MLRVVIDTNIFIRFLMRPSKAVSALIQEYWIQKKIQVVTASELLVELQEVLQRKHIQSVVHAAEAEILVAALLRQAEILPDLTDIPIYSRDRKDDRFVAYALFGRADYLVTLDEDLLVLNQIGEVRILTPRQLVTELALDN
jgi:putative PIN family toxin of toxin-antitoxin system